MKARGNQGYFGCGWCFITNNWKQLPKYHLIHRVTHSERDYEACRWQIQSSDRAAGVVAGYFKNSFQNLEADLFGTGSKEYPQWQHNSGLSRKYLCLRWVNGYSGVTGNEVAYYRAREGVNLWSALGLPQTATEAGIKQVAQARVYPKVD